MIAARPFWAVLLAAIGLPALAAGSETKESFEAVFAEAVAARQQAAAAGHEWRDTRKLLKRSEAAAEGGDFDDAVALAEKAKRQGDMAVEQAGLQARTWQDAVPKLIVATARTTAATEVATNQAGFDGAYSVAVASRKHAAKLGHEWRDTRKLLKRAKAAAAESDFVTAVKLAEEARLQSEQAIEQARWQASVWQDAVPK